MAESLNFEQIAEIKQAFELLDRNCRGVLKVRDIKSGFEQLGQNLSKKLIQKMIDEIDGDGNRTIDFPEFLVLLAREFNRKQLESDVEKAFTHNELEQIRKALKAFDKKTKRRIKSKYLKEFFEVLEVELTLQEFNDIVNEFDNGKGYIEYTQIHIALARKMNRIRCEDNFKQAFKFFDCDKDGLISVNDLKNALFTLGEKMSDEEIEEMIKEADLDQDGFLNEAEFIAIMRPEAKYMTIPIL